MDTFTDKELDIKEQNSDMYRRNTVVSDNVDYYLDSSRYQVQSPEDFLLAKEDACLANEDFEGSPYQSDILGFKTPHSSEEVIEIFARRKVLAEENQIFNQVECNDEITKSENRYKRLVAKRQPKIDELHPRMMKLYQRYA